jgi:hypothetical protein
MNFISDLCGFRTCRECGAETSPPNFCERIARIAVGASTLPPAWSCRFAMFAVLILSTIGGAADAAAFVSQTPIRRRASKLGQVPGIPAGLRPSGHLVYTSDLLIIFSV